MFSIAAMTLITLMLLSQVQVNIPLPTIVFPAPPPLVVVEPGIQVIEDQDDEIFVVDNAYWVRRDGRWFKSPDHRGHWVVVEEKFVPGHLVKVPHGRYKRYKHAKQELKEDRKELREDKKELKEDRKELKEDRKEHKGGKHGKG